MSEPYDDDRDGASYADRICDSDCMGVNHCGGHVTCPECGDTVCGCEADPDTGLCAGCYSSMKYCANCTERFWGVGMTTSDGEEVCSQECLDDYESGLESGRVESDKVGKAEDCA